MKTFQFYIMTVAFCLACVPLVVAGEAEKPGASEPADVRPLPLDEMESPHAVIPTPLKAPPSRATEREGQAGGAGPTHDKLALSDQKKKEFETEIQTHLAQWDKKIAALSQQSRSEQNNDTNLKMSVANNLDLRRLAVQSDLEAMNKTKDPKYWGTLKKRIERTLAQMHEEGRKVPVLAE